MTQANPIIGSGKTGVEYRTEDNSGKQALLNHHKGSSAPSYAEAGMLWLDDTSTPWILKFYDGTDWIAVTQVDATANTAKPYFGSSVLGFTPAASDNAVMRSDGTGGDTQGSGVLIDDSDNVSGITALTAEGDALFGNTSGNGARLEVYEFDYTAYNGSATDGQMDVGATLLVNNPADSNTAIAQIVLAQRADTGGYSRIAVTGGGTQVMKFVVGDTERAALKTGWVVGSPTGGDKGAGTINAQAVYDDNTLLTCYVVEAYQNNAVDLSLWDSFAPDGQQHFGAHKFAARMGTDYDPLDMDKFWQHALDKGHLTAMPNRDNFNPDTGISTGEIAQRLWETVEIQAVHIQQLNTRTKAQQETIDNLLQRIEVLEST
ncbi:MAG: hypothetical protein OXT65_08690 [Alphaproteobacteria bacterium]|nr:hypothetical protein [Alphaproteobacteria bacterium]